MPARHFTAASTEHIDLSLGNVGAFGPGSLAFICRPTSFAASRAIFSAGASDTVGYRFLFTNAGKLDFIGNAAASLAPTVYTASNWLMAGVSKATGAVAPRFHAYDYSTNTWVHEAGSGTVNNTSAPATRAAFGVSQAVGLPFEGDIAMGAVWNVVLTDAQFESLAFDVNTWFQVQPRALWMIDQDATTQKVIDTTGGGANQSGITGTTLATASVPIFSRGFPMVAL